MELVYINAVPAPASKREIAYKKRVIDVPPVRNTLELAKMAVASCVLHSLMTGILEDM